MAQNQEEDQSLTINDVEYFPVNNQMKESIRVQKTDYMRQQLRTRMEQEDALMVRLMQEQRIIDSMRDQIDDKLQQSEEVTRFNREMQEKLNKQVYELHGVSQDKLEGIREYKSAYYRGCAFGLFLMSVGLSVFAGLLHGFQSEICMFLLVYTGLQGALLAQERKRWKLADLVCKGLYLLLFPIMLVMFILHELKYEQYDLVLPYVNMGAVGLVVFATIAYFLYDPYSKAKENVKKARKHMEDIERQARKEVKKNTKLRQKQEKKDQKRQRKEEKREERRIRREGQFSLRRWLKNLWERFKSLFAKKSEPETWEEEELDQEAGMSEDGQAGEGSAQETSMSGNGQAGQAMSSENKTP